MRRYLPAIVAVLVLLISAGTYRVIRLVDLASRAQADTSGEGVGDISVRLERSEVLSRVEGVPEWSLRLARMEFRQSPGSGIESFAVGELSRVTDGVLYRRGTPEGRFRADRATLDRAGNRIDVRGNIRVRTPRGDTVAADHLVWSPSDDYARFPNGMRGTVRGYRLQAPQMLFALRRRVVQCPQGAEVSRGSETLRAASLVWDVEQGRLTCSGMVSGARRGVSFVGQDAVLDERTRTLRVARARFTLQPDQFQDFEGWHP